MPAQLHTIASKNNQATDKTKDHMKEPTLTNISKVYGKPENRLHKQVLGKVLCPENRPCNMDFGGRKEKENEVLQ